MDKKRFASNFKKLYDASIVGGNCHIVTDDRNMEDTDIAWCLDAVEENFLEQTSELQQVERDILNYLLALPYEERYSHLDYAEEMLRASYGKAAS